MGVLLSSVALKEAANDFRVSSGSIFEWLAVNVNLFVQQMGKVLENTPEKLGKFHFDEFEIHAEISADGTIAVLGTGVHAGIGGGLRFVFRRGNSE